MLTHAKEKLHFIKNVISFEGDFLNNAAEDLNAKKVDLRLLKLGCNATKKKTDVFQLRCLKVTHDDLLKDMQHLMDQKTSLSAEFQDLKRRMVNIQSISFFET